MAREKSNPTIHTLKTLWPEIRPFAVPLLIAFVLGLIMASCQAKIVSLVKPLIDQAFGQVPGENLPPSQDLIITIPLTLVGLFFVLGLCRYFHLYINKYTSERVAANIRRRLQKKFLGLNLSFHNTYKEGSGGLLSRTLNDVNVLQQGLFNFTELLRAPFEAMAMIGVMLYYDWKLTIALLLAAPLIIWFLRQVAKSLRKYGHLSQQAMEKVTMDLKESLDGIRIIQSFNLEDMMRGKFSGSVDKYVETRRKVIRREELSSPITEFIGAIIFAAVCIYVGFQIRGGEATVGVFFTFLGALGYFQKPVKKLQEAFIKVQQTVVVVDRIFEILDDHSEVPQTKVPKAFPIDWQTVTYRNVSFSYGGELVLKNISVNIHRGEVIALVGESGSGKSSFVNLLERFFDPTEGEILIDNIPITEFDLKDLRKHIALVTQDVFLFRDTVTHNVSAGNLQRQPVDIKQAVDLANATAFVESCENGYQTMVGERGSLFSGGEKQRLSIARAIYKDAPILILDEATSALDSASEVEVQKGLEHLMEGRTALVIAHRLSTVVKADRILVLKKGVIVEQGKHESLIRQDGEYSRFHRLQNL